MRLIGTASIVLLLSACRPQGDTSAPEPPTEGSSTSEVSEPKGPAEPKAPTDECVALPSADVALAAAAQGMRKLEESRDGEHYLTGPFEEAMISLRTAAEQGHRGAQSLYGRTMFETLFLAQAPTPEQRDDYVAAFMFLRIAALRGDPSVQDYLPGLTADTPPSAEEPLDQLPAEWLHEAYRRADAWMACHGATVGERGAQEQ